MKTSIILFTLSIILFTFLMLTSVSIGQHPNDRSRNKEQKYNDSKSSIIALVKSKKIHGKLYDAKRVILELTNEGRTEDYLIDSTFNFRFLNSNKISFYIKFSEAASNIRYGYAEMIFQPYTTKMIYLNDNIDSINQSKSGNLFEQTVYAKSSMRYGSLTLTEYKIKSYLNEKKGRLFIYTKTDRIKEFEKY